MLEPIFEANFCEGSYGFRPGRGCREAIAAIRKWVRYGYSHVIDADVAVCFDSIDHKLLLELVQRRVRKYRGGRRPPCREGRRKAAARRGSNRRMHPWRSTGVVGTARGEGRQLKNGG